MITIFDRISSHSKAEQKQDLQNMLISLWRKRN